MSDLDLTVSGQAQSLDAAVGADSARALQRARDASRRALLPALAISGAALGAVMLGALLHRGSPWAGVNALASVLPGDRRRRALERVGVRRVRRRFDLVRTLSGAGMIYAGSFTLAILRGVLGRKEIGGNRVGRGVILALTAFTLDRVVGAGWFWPRMKRALGPGGLFMTYAAIGTAGALAARLDTHGRRDPIGGELAAGVGAM